jgi:hypothetical protein
MKKGVVGLSLLLTISLIPAYSATPPKAGSVCSKQGVTKTFQGKKFTCYPDTHSNADYDWDTNSDSDTITKFNSIWNNVTCANQFAEYTNANGR